MDTPQRRHRKAVSAPKTMNYPTPTLSTSSLLPTDHSRHSRTASRIMISVKRSLTSSTSKMRVQETSTSRLGIYSTPEERMPPQSTTPTLFVTSEELTIGTAPPTIEQIAMGLHVSRTPHLRPLGTPRSAYPRGGHNSPTPVALPPPPARSSMKKPSQPRSPYPAKQSETVSSGSNSHLRPFDVSTSTVTSITTPPSSARSSSGVFSFSKFKMGRLLHGSRSSSGSAPSSSILSTPVSSPRHSSSDFDAVQKKAVRFQAEDDRGDD